MRGAVFYINAGKGHFIPSVAIVENLNAMGHTAEAFDFFQMMGAMGWATTASKWWRFMLRHPKFECWLETKLDNGWLSVSERTLGAALARNINFVNWFEDYKPDFIITTQYSCTYVMPELLKANGYNIPCYAYSPDTFVTPKVSINNDIDRFYIATEEGRQELIGNGQHADSVSLCSFPLRNDCYRQAQVSKKEARKKLQLKNLFTVLINLGGEGLGKTDLPDALIKTQDASLQILIVGTLDKWTKKHYEQMLKKYPGVSLRLAGYVKEMNTWLCASDMLVGKAGPNAMCEAIYCKRPYLVTSLLYMSDKVVGYFEKYGIGWYRPKLKDQVALVMKSAKDPTFLPTIEANFTKVPMIFGADKFAAQIIEDTERWYTDKN